MNEPKTIERAEDTGCCGAAPCSATEAEEFDEVIHLVSALAYKAAEVRQQLARAGVGTFDTKGEYDYFYRLEMKMDKMRSKFQKRLDRMQAQSPNVPDQGRRASDSKQP